LTVLLAVRYPLSRTFTRVIERRSVGDIAPRRRSI